MNDREVVIPEVEGKTIGSMRFILTGSACETEVAIDFTDGTSFSGTVCPKIEFNGELYIGGTAGEPKIIKRYGE